jgi:spore coat protein CotF
MCHLSDYQKVKCQKPSNTSAHPKTNNLREMSNLEPAESMEPCNEAFQ